jgi:ribonuclease BN (tRNA processing enzyme)
LQLVIIGSGTAVPQKDRSAPCYLLRTSSGDVLMDLGPGSIWGVARHTGVSVRDVHAIVLSHLHMDHCGDLAPFLFAHRAEQLARTSPLHLLGPPGLSAHLDDLRNVWKKWVEPAGFDLNVLERDGHEKTPAYIMGDLRFHAAPTNHSLFNLAWRVDGADGSGVLFTGDGEITRPLVELGRIAPHTLISECAAGPGETLPGHLNPGQAGELAAQCGSSKLVLSHINPGQDPETLVTFARKQFDGEVVVAEDGMEIEV